MVIRLQPGVGFLFQGENPGGRWSDSVARGSRRTIADRQPAICVGAPAPSNAKPSAARFRLPFSSLLAQAAA